MVRNYVYNMIVEKLSIFFLASAGSAVNHHINKNIPLRHATLSDVLKRFHLAIRARSPAKRAKISKLTRNS